MAALTPDQSRVRKMVREIRRGGDLFGHNVRGFWSEGGRLPYVARCQVCGVEAEIKRVEGTIIYGKFMAPCYGPRRGA